MRSSPGVKGIVPRLRPPTTPLRRKVWTRKVLVTVSVEPRRKERALVNGTMFLRPDSGILVRLQGRLAKTPSFWVKSVDIVRTYQEVHGVIVPVALESQAQVRILGAASFNMTYEYQEIDGRRVP